MSLDEPKLTLAFFLRHAYFFVDSAGRLFSDPPSDFSPEAAKAQGLEALTLRELCDRYPEYRAEYQRLEQILEKSGSA